jgi:preprotein translocase subunit SecF
MKKIYHTMFIVSLAVTLAALGALLVWGLNLGVDFTGGSVLELGFEKARPGIEEVRVVVDELIDGEISVTPAGERGMLIRTETLTESSHQTLLSALKVKFEGDFGRLQENRFDSIGPTIGNELKNKSIQGMFVVLAGIIIYIALVFRKMSSVLSPWAMGLAAIASMVHTVIVPLGVFAYLGEFNNVELGAIFIAAILTVLGYSVSDTVVVFDRIRENVVRFGRKESFGHLIHQSIIQTLTRSISTGFATILSLVAVAFFGGDTLQYFSLALIMGIVLGSYSSIFIASPLLYYWTNWRRGGK